MQSVADKDETEHQHLAKERKMTTMADGPKFPDVTVELSGHDGNTGAIMAAVSRALRRGGATPAELDEYRRETLSGDYENVLQTAMKWVNVE